MGCIKLVLQTHSWLKVLLLINKKTLKIKQSTQKIRRYQKIDKRKSRRKTKKREIIKVKARLSSWHAEKQQN